MVEDLLNLIKSWTRSRSHCFLMRRIRPTVRRLLLFRASAPTCVVSGLEQPVGLQLGFLPVLHSECLDPTTWPLELLVQPLEPLATFRLEARGLTSKLHREGTGTDQDGRTTDFISRKRIKRTTVMAARSL